MTLLGESNPVQRPWWLRPLVVDRSLLVDLAQLHNGCLKFAGRYLMLDRCGIAEDVVDPPTGIPTEVRPNP